ncbi:Holliday junction resolvase RuvX [Actinomycetaceae bacterium TAE3-ERU4]|nr:Holliday junction resolvase RuvX [Actinomycetaceae bacterium TAE3-ERU4]
MSLEQAQRWSFDVGRARIGAARSPRGTSVVLPVNTFCVDTAQTYWDDIEDALEEYPADIIYVGLPLHLNGKSGASVQMVREFATELASLYPLAEIRLVDERLSSVSAHQRLAEAGVSGKNRKSIIDQAAAVVILETAIAFEQENSGFAGKLFSRAKRERK